MIALDTRTRSKLAWVAAMLTPIVAVQLVRLVTASMPQQATAAPVQEAEPAPAAPPLPPLTNRQREAIRWLGSQSVQTANRSPMDRMEPQKIEIPPPEPKPIEQAAPADNSPPDLRLTGLIGDGKNALASIDHKLRRLGDTVAPGWKVVKIDSRNRQVVVRHTDGRELTLEPR